MPHLAESTEIFLINHALRVDGYAWALAQGAPDGARPKFLIERLYQPFRTTRRIPADPDAALALNFCLHRRFYHYGQLPGYGDTQWWEMCLLYLHTYRLPTPSAFRHSRFALQWEQRPKGSAEAAAAEIRSLLMPPASLP